MDRKAIATDVGGEVQSLFASLSTELVSWQLFQAVRSYYDDIGAAGHVLVLREFRSSQR